MSSLAERQVDLLAVKEVRSMLVSYRDFNDTLREKQVDQARLYIEFVRGFEPIN
jgi:uncharacterized membrane protein